MMSTTNLTAYMDALGCTGGMSALVPPACALLQSALGISTASQTEADCNAKVPDTHRCLLRTDHCPDGIETSLQPSETVADGDILLPQKVFETLAGSVTGLHSITVSASVESARATMGHSLLTPHDAETGNVKYPCLSFEDACTMVEGAEALAPAFATLRGLGPRRRWLVLKGLHGIGKV